MEESAQKSDKSGLVCLLLLLLVGWLVAHRFYVGKIGTAILFIITAGGLGIWWLIDLIMLITGAFTDSQGRKVKLSN